MKRFAISIGLGITGLIISSLVFEKTALGIVLAFSGALIGGLITPEIYDSAGSRPPKAKKAKTKEAIEHEQWLAYNTYIKKKR